MSYVYFFLANRFVLQINKILGFFFWHSVSQTGGRLYIKVDVKVETDGVLLSVLFASHQAENAFIGRSAL